MLSSEPQEVSAHHEYSSQGRRWVSVSVQTHTPSHHHAHPGLGIPIEMNEHL